MRSPRRLLAGACAALALCLGASACDSSPYAVMVGNHALSQSTLNGQLSDLSANQAFVRLIEAPASSGGAGIRVTGDTSASYSSQWTAAVLTAAATAAVVHQHLAATGNQPAPAQILAVQAVDATFYGVLWYQFTPSTRSLLVQRDADMAQVVPKDPRVNSASISSFARQYSTSLFTRVCLRTIQVSVPGAGGTVDFPASEGKAKALVTAIDKAGPAGANSSALGGSVDCYSQAAFAQLPLPVVKGALAAKAGSAAAPERNSDGYQVVGVVSRTPIDTTTREFSQALSVGTQINSIYSTGTNLQPIKSLVGQARVRVDPMYGTWQQTRNGWAVVPPSGPAPHAASVAGSI